MTYSTQYSDAIQEIVLYTNDKYKTPLLGKYLLDFLNDRKCVYHRLKMVYDQDPLNEDEFAYMHQVDKNPSKGFMLYMHPVYKDDLEALPYLVLYHIPVINFGNNVTHEVSELFGSRLMNMSVENYYQKLCELFSRMAN